MSSMEGEERKGERKRGRKGGKKREKRGYACAEQLPRGSVVPQARMFCLPPPQTLHQKPVGTSLGTPSRSGAQGAPHWHPGKLGWGWGADGLGQALSLVFNYYIKCLLCHSRIG